MDQVQGAIASGRLKPGDQLPTIRQVAVDLTINPNTVTRAYREMEIRGIVESQQGTGTFIAEQQASVNGQFRDNQLKQLVEEISARAGASGFTLAELIRALGETSIKSSAKRR